MKKVTFGKNDFYEKLSKFIKNIILIYLVFLMGFTIKNIRIYIPHVEMVFKTKKSILKKKSEKQNTYPLLFVAFFIEMLLFL